MKYYSISYYHPISKKFLIVCKDETSVVTSVSLMQSIGFIVLSLVKSAKTTHPYAIRSGIHIP